MWYEIDSLDLLHRRVAHVARLRATCVLEAKEVWFPKELLCESLKIADTTLPVASCGLATPVEIGISTGATLSVVHNDAL
ncbi:hypothetical protein Spb1_17160 [Planctopirus ephydatiae]|uniref:Uncharacterized protein n=1 Tax=Planctopirus ephydatiae TaxID=2528019 RepID=A0A518GMJ8_9PLAN|nr:hypothetical protein Spb1_17160 [Planctopirus ephydatiae]